MNDTDEATTEVARQLGEVALKIAIARAKATRGAPLDLKALEQAFASVDGALRLVDVRDLDLARQSAFVARELDALRQDVAASRGTPPATATGTTRRLQMPV
ncbi:hypothetical protein DF3PA_40048 [Candidatus Defluviicoccus seviourii]|uniref:Uncharacterized protein n=1 Tax=Candidatus Defluviicoccus seviourii TaxID=2565273 RepID=A0A564WFB9_9PROT|nr:hypothetical protein DF3PA_40048 [Candidatus Defluviicoccus seviourii]